MHAWHIDINTKLGRARCFGNGVDPSGFLTDVLKLGCGLQCRIGLDIQRLRCRNEVGVGVARLAMHNEAIVGTQRRGGYAQIL